MFLSIWWCHKLKRVERTFIFLSASPTTALWHRWPKWLILSFLVRGPKGGAQVNQKMLKRSQGGRKSRTRTHTCVYELTLTPRQGMFHLILFSVPGINEHTTCLGPNWPLGGAQAGQSPMAALKRLWRPKNTRIPAHRMCDRTWAWPQQVNWPLEEKHQHSPRILEKTRSLST